MDFTCPPYRHRVHGVGRGGGQAVFWPDFNQIPWNPVKVRFKPGRNPLNSCDFRGTRRTPTVLKSKIRLSLSDPIAYDPICLGPRTLRNGVLLPSKRLLSAFYNTPPSKDPSKNLCLYWNPCETPSKNPSKKHLLLENLLRTLLRSVRLHDPLGVCPT